MTAQGPYLPDISLCGVRAVTDVQISPSAFRRPVDLLLGQPIYYYHSHPGRNLPTTIAGRIASVGADDKSWPRVSIDCCGQPQGEALLSAVRCQQPGSLQIVLETEAIGAERVINQVLHVTSMAIVVVDPQKLASDEIPQLDCEPCDFRRPPTIPGRSGLALWAMGVK